MSPENKAIEPPCLTFVGPRPMNPIVVVKNVRSRALWNAIPWKLFTLEIFNARTINAACDPVSSSRPYCTPVDCKWPLTIEVIYHDSSWRRRRDIPVSLDGSLALIMNSQSWKWSKKYSGCLLVTASPVTPSKQSVLPKASSLGSLVPGYVGCRAAQRSQLWSASTICIAMMPCCGRARRTRRCHHLGRILPVLQIQIDSSE